MGRKNAVALLAMGIKSDYLPVLTRLHREAEEAGAIALSQRVMFFANDLNRARLKVTAVMDPERVLKEEEE